MWGEIGHRLIYKNNVIILTVKKFGELDSMKRKIEYDRLFNDAHGQCKRCGRKLDRNKHGRREDDGWWEIHHHPQRSDLETTFKGVIDPNMRMFTRVLCWPCHRETLAKPDPPVIFDNPF